VGLASEQSIYYLLSVVFSQKVVFASKIFEIERLRDSGEKCCVNFPGHFLSGATHFGC
jgi:hypothetical protein